MKRPGLIRGLFFLYLLYTGIGSAYRLQHYQVGSRSPLIEIDASYLHSSQITALVDLVETLHRQRLLSAVDCIMQVQQQFPYVVCGSATFNPGSSITYHFVTSKPVCRIHTAQVLMQVGTVHSDQVCEPSLLPYLPEVSVDQCALQQERSMHVLANLICQIDPSILQTHLFFWKGHGQGVITDRQLPQFQIVCDAQHVPTEPILDLCKRIRDEVSIDTQRVKGCLVADIRFAKQIVMYRDMGGRYG